MLWYIAAGSAIGGASRYLLGGVVQRAAGSGFPIGTLVKLNTEELAVVSQTHPEDPFRPQVKLITDSKGNKLEAPLLTNTWDRDSRGDFPRAVVEAVDGPQVGIDPLAYL